MSRRVWVRRWGLVVGGLLVAVSGIASWAQQAPEHGGHGTPEAWKFSWPAGNPAAGREVFVKLECYTCHEVKGEQFPKPDLGDDPGKVGPEVSSMAPLHAAEYFAEAIINPNAVVEEGKGYRAPDGKSKMPSYNDLVTVQEVIDLVAYLKGLKANGGTPAHGAAAPSGGDGGSGGQMMPGGQMPRH
ncbi:MAG: c-type cytochrome [candidate division NC10 bacterium]|nr:c-type cytochrome [candidate division NC10 bacterium]